MGKKYSEKKGKEETTHGGFHQGIINSFINQQLLNTLVLDTIRQWFSNLEITEWHKILIIEVHPIVSYLIILWNDLIVGILKDTFTLLCNQV